MPARFRRHPAARLYGPDGAQHLGADIPAGVIDDRPGPAALVQALAACDNGIPFRIGGTGLPCPASPAEGGQAVFETLTSGSTGVPRRIRRSQASWTASFAVNATLFGIGPTASVAIPGRLSQSLALYGALEALHLGAALHLLDGLRPDRMHAALATRRIDVVYATPAQLRQLLDVDAPEVPGLRLILSGGAKLDPETRAGLRRRFPGATIREFYGAAETSFVTLADDTTPEGSVGRAYPGVEIDLRGPAGARQVWVRSPYLFDGYAGDPGGAVWQDGWLSVGEIGRIEAGLLHLDGRAGRMVTVAGQNVFPEAIEAFLLAQPGVSQAAVVARPDRLRGHVLEAVVNGGDAETLLFACRARLGPLMSPRKMHLLADWPMLPSGKTDLAVLNRLFT